MKQCSTSLMQNKKLLCVLLLISLSVNVLFVACLFGNILGKGVPFLMFARGEFAELISGLPPEKRDELKAEAKKTLLPIFSRYADDQSELRDKLADLLGKEKVSKKELENAFAEIRAKTVQGQTEIHDNFIRIILSLTPDERKELAVGLHKILDDGQKSREKLEKMLEK